MKPIELAQKYMEIFFSGENVEDLSGLFADEFSFVGPFYRFDSALAYIDSLQSDPPQKCEFQILHTFEKTSSVCFIYQFIKPGISTPMAQTFEIRGGKICNVLLIFDTGVFQQ